ncbi:MAG TPA: glycosyltransferase family 2 protein [Candidatus Nanoarchaeia archaeon]|nr:glycosyltransferase family 2 protein [Candidatus Nanoarchaeia archaeon]
MITIIITSFKEPHSVGKAIEAVLANKITEKYELLVAAPDKETAIVIQSYARKHKQVKYFKDKGQGKANALNELFQRAKGDILILTDGDVFMSTNAVSALLHAFKDPNVGCVAGRPVATNDKQTILGYFSHLLVDAGAHTIRQKLHDQGRFLECTGYLFAFRNKIRKIPVDVAEDSIIPYLLWKQGYRVCYVPEAKVFVKYPNNLKDFVKQRVRTAKSHEKLTKYAPDFPRVKTFSNELIFGLPRALGYARSMREFFWTFCLLFVRLYIWYRVFYEIRIHQKNYGDNWERIESTK